MKEYIVYVKLINDKKISAGRMLTNKFLSTFGPSADGEKWKLVYFEFSSSKRLAEAKEKKLSSLNKKVLIETVKRSNPELLDLKFTVNRNNIFEELIY